MACKRTWIRHHLSRDGNHLLVEVDPDYLKDRFNHQGILADVPEEIVRAHSTNHEAAMKIMMDLKQPNNATAIEKASAEFFYGILHARWATTAMGIKQYREKWYNGYFGVCQKLKCGSNLIPIGPDPDPGISKVKLYCYRCNDLFHCENSNLDSAYFGPNLPQMLRMMSPAEAFSRVVHFTEKIKPHYIVDEDHRLTNPKTRASQNGRPQISVNENNPIAVLDPTNQESFILKLKKDAKLIEHSIKSISISGDNHNLAKAKNSNLDSSK